LRPCPLLIRLSLTQLEIQTLHRALERDSQTGMLFGQELHSAVWFLARAIEVELQEQLRTDRTGVLCWLNGATKEEVIG